MSRVSVRTMAAAMLAGLASMVCAQSVTLQPAKTGPMPSARERADRAEAAETRVFYLRNATSQGEQNELLTALRNMVNPVDKIFLVPSARAIVVRADPDDLALAERLLGEMDRAGKSYRLTYTFAEKEGSRILGQQHFVIELTAGQRAQAKGGNRLPITVGSSPAAEQSQVTYIDVGLSVDATADEIVNGLRLRNKVERSAVAEERASASVAGDPVIRQSLLEGTFIVPLGKAVVMGSLDVPGSTRTIEVSVVAEPVK